MSTTQQGYSILEVLIALAISLILLAGVLQIFLNAKNIYNQQLGFAQLQENARFISEYLPRIIRLSGYRSLPVAGQNFNSISSIFTSSPYVTGTENSNYNNSDAFSISYQGSGSGSGVPDGTIRDCLNRPVDANVIATSIFSLTTNNELQCQAINPSASPTTSTQVLVTGIENMQVLYGEDLDGDNGADRYVPAGFATLNMNRVVSLRVSLLLRSDNPIKMIPTTFIYNLLGTHFTPIDNKYQRVQVTFTVVLRNMMNKPL